MTTRPALAIAAGIILAVFFTAGLLAPVLAPYDLEAMDLTARLLMPFESAAHILGTDELGRDIFSRLLYSIRMSFVLAVVGTLLGAVIGTLLGFLAARFGGIVDDAVNCGIDFTASLPFIILALTIIAFLGTDVTVIIVIMAVYGWDRYARLTRNLSRSAYTEGYACALEGLGLPTVSIALRHILPNIASAHDPQLPRHDPPRDLALLPRRRRSASDELPRDHAGLRARLPHDRLVDRRDPRPRDRRLHALHVHPRRLGPAEARTRRTIRRHS